MKRLALAIAFACVLTGAVRAGEIHTTGAVAPPTPSTATVGEIPSTGGASSVVTTGATASQESTALTIILALLGIVP